MTIGQNTINCLIVHKFHEIRVRNALEYLAAYMVFHLYMVIPGVQIILIQTHYLPVVRLRRGMYR